MPRVVKTAKAQHWSAYAVALRNALTNACRSGAGWGFLTPNWFGPDFSVWIFFYGPFLLLIPSSSCASSTSFPRARAWGAPQNPQGPNISVRIPPSPPRATKERFQPALKPKLPTLTAGAEGTVSTAHTCAIVTIQRIVSYDYELSCVCALLAVRRPRICAVPPLRYTPCRRAALSVLGSLAE